MRDARTEQEDETVAKAWRRDYLGLAGWSEIRILPVLRDRKAIRRYNPPDISLSRSGSESVSIPAMLWKAWLETTEMMGPLLSFSAL
jgi:hypothetical protein